MYIKQLEVGLMQNFNYLIGDPATHECAYVDPAWEVRIAAASSRRSRVKGVTGVGRASALRSITRSSGGTARK